MTPMLRGIRALVIDDNATNRLILREMLTSRGAEVSEAEDGPQGLASLERARLSGRPFKLVLLDCRMPGMDGFQVAEKIKSIGYDGIPLLMLSSDGLKIELARVGRLGLDAYLVKPVRRLELFEAIAAAIARHDGDPVRQAVSRPPFVRVNRRAASAASTAHSVDRRCKGQSHSCPRLSEEFESASRRGGKRADRRGEGKSGKIRSDPDGHPDACDGRLRSDAPHPGARAANRRRASPDHRAHRLGAGGRRAA